MAFFFIPSSLQKRLLRYALSRVDLLDTDALDLENLDIGWGKRSTIELRDVALNKTKLAALVKLPEQFEVSEASVASVKITVPADIHTSSIVISIQSVRAQVQAADLQNAQQTEKASQINIPFSPTKRGRNPIPSRSHGRFHHHDADEEAGLPTVNDLAKSFLAEEPLQEKEQLRAALASQPSDLKQSIASWTSVESESDDGFGTGLTLPSFLAAFFRSISDRLQVNVQDVQIKLDMANLCNDVSQQPEDFEHPPTAFCFEIGEIQIRDVVSSTSTLTYSNSVKNTSPSTSKRQILLRKIRGSLLTEGPLPEASQPWEKTSLQDALISATGDPRAAKHQFLGRTGGQGTHDPEASSSGCSPDFAASLLGPRTPPIDELPESLDTSYDLHNAIRSCRDERDYRARASIQRSRSNTSTSPVHTPRLSTISLPAVSTLGDSVGPESESRTPSSKDIENDQSFRTGLPKVASPTTSSRGMIPSKDDLAQSMLFSNDEAESLYMSAINASSPTTSFRADMPGAWGMESEQGDAVNKRAPQVSQSDSSEVMQPDEITSKETPSANVPRPPKPVLFLRQLFEIDEVEVGIPSAKQAPEPTSLSLSSQSPGYRARFSTLPETSELLHDRALSGSFSAYAKTRSQGHNHPKDSSISLPQSRLTASKHDILDTSESLEIAVGSLRAHIDLDTVRFLTAVTRRLTTQSSLPTERNTSSKDEGSSVLTIRLSLRRVSFNLMETLGKDPTQPTPSMEQSHSSPTPLSLQIRDFFGNLSRDAVQIAADECVVRARGQTVLSFDEDVRMRTSMRDLKEPMKNDLKVVWQRRSTGVEVEMSTKPIRLNVDLNAVENGLESISDLGSLLGLASPVKSSNPSDVSHGNRTVRFEAQAVGSSSKETTSFKTTARVGGLYLVIRSSDHSVTCNSSAIKIAQRDTGLGVAIDDIKLKGPYLNDSDNSAINLRVRGLNLRSLAVPEEADLTRLISLLTPSKDRFQDDDDLLVDTLIRQRRKGPVLRLTASSLHLNVESRTMAQAAMEAFGQDLSRLSAFANYLPEDDRPGLMTLAKVDQVVVKCVTDHALGQLSLTLDNASIAHIGIPSLIACSIGGIHLEREDETLIIAEVLPTIVTEQQPMFMARLIGDEPEPTLKLKLWNVAFEYSVPLIMTVLGLPESAVVPDLAANLAASLSSLTSSVPFDGSRRSPTRQTHSLNTRPLRMHVALRECGIGLKPRTMASKALFVLTDTTISCALPNMRECSIHLDIRKAGLLIIDDGQKLDATLAHTPRPSQSDPISRLCNLGFVSVSSISAALVDVRVRLATDEEVSIVDVEFKDELFVLETCADSTQTLVETLSDLKPPLPPSQGTRYRTEVAPMEDMMASFSGDAFAMKGRDLATEATDDHEDGEDLDLDFEDLGGPTSAGARGALPSTPNGYNITGHKFGSAPHKLQQHDDLNDTPSRSPKRKASPAKKWDSQNNRYVPVSSTELAMAPLRVRVKDVHFIWNLFDGYDWQKTRDTITRAVYDIEQKASDRKRRSTHEEEVEQEPVIGDFLFNSIYIGVSASADPQELTRQINRNMDDLVSETASLASTPTSRPSSAHKTQRPHRRLKLERSKRHKLAIELRGVSADFFVYPSGAETQSSIDFRVTDLEIFDHVPTSTWKKFVTYMHDAGPRTPGKPMVRLEICDVRPIPELLASELVIKATVLPLRLHIDQDALDFMTRFFEFKDNSTHTTPSATTEEPYLQRVEVLSVPVKLDYKPKKVDFAGLRSGRTTEFMNFFILDGADFTLKHTIVYGTSGFDKLRFSLEDVWMPDIRGNQLPSVLSGLNGVRTVVNVGTGVRDLVMIPIQEYKKDGRVVRSISKGARAFAKTTGGELTRFGARLAIGAQNVLQGAEDFFVGSPAEAVWDDELDEEEKRAISHYANQPAGILQGLKGAARSLERDILVTKDAIIAISGEMKESGTAEGAARAVVRHAPTLILRPMIGASKAISQTLMGATNTVDPQNRKRMEDKYKKY